jgi:hypothetical protein
MERGVLWRSETDRRIDQPGFDIGLQNILLSGTVRLIGALSFSAGQSTEGRIR